MKVIDLLNKIANGEEIKAKLKFKLGDIIINYYGMNNYYHTPEYDIAYIDKGCTTHDFTLGTLIKSLNYEVEIIEEKSIMHSKATPYEPYTPQQKKIEKLDFYEVNGGGDEYDKFYLKNNGQDIFLCTDDDDFEIIVLKKINEIIDVLEMLNDKIK